MASRREPGFYARLCNPPEFERLGRGQRVESSAETLGEFQAERLLQVKNGTVSSAPVNVFALETQNFSFKECARPNYVAVRVLYVFLLCFVVCTLVLARTRVSCAMAGILRGRCNVGTCVPHR